MHWQAPALFADPTNAHAAPASTVDPSLTTYEAAVECATAKLVEQRGTFANAKDAAFKAGACTGKIQSFMLDAQARYPDCFPRISLEEGIAIFVKWAEGNKALGGEAFPSGLRKAFEEAVPCMKK